MPIRRSSAVGEIKDRGTLAQSYDQVIQDLQAAESLLPLTTAYKTRPSRAAALGLLARVYLTIQNYQQAAVAASACLELNNRLIDYNQLNPTASRPVPAALPNGNDEVLYYSSLTGLSFLIASLLTMIDPELYNSYDNHDLRKSIFFRDRGNGVITFKGNYSGASTVFAGIATDEIYLIRAEAYARTGNVAGSMTDLNELMIKRWNNSVAYPVITAETPSEALRKILTERRKELVYRNLRWTDLRRLNLEPPFAKTITRTIKGITYTLPANDNRYVFAIPDAEIAISGIPQNIR